MSQVIVNALIAASGYLLVGIGFSVVYTASRFFNFAHASVITVGPYAAFVLKAWLALPLSVACAGGILASAICGIGLERGVYGPARTRGASAASLLLASLGLYVILTSLIVVVFGAGTVSLRSGDVARGLPLFGARATLSQIWSLVAGATGCAGTWLLLTRTLSGKIMRAVGSDADLAYVYGCDRERVVLRATLLGSAMAGAAGIFAAFDTDITPFMGFQMLLGGMVAMIVGGVGSVFGIAAGALFLASAQNLVAWYISTAWRDVPVFLILVAFLISRPRGFFGVSFGGRSA